MARGSKLNLLSESVPVAMKIPGFESQRVACPSQAASDEPGGGSIKGLWISSRVPALKATKPSAHLMVAMRPMLTKKVDSPDRKVAKQV